MLTVLRTAVCLVLLTSAMLTQALEALVPDPPPIAADSYVLIDYNTGVALASKQAHAGKDPASLTKLMTAYIVYEALDEGLIHLSDLAKVSSKARRTEGSRMFIEEGSFVTVDDLIAGVVVQSGNDASIALVEHTVHSEEAFVDLMNTKAGELGLKNSYFTNATGLPDEEHIMTAYDVAILSRALIRDFPLHYELYSHKEFSYNNIRQYNRNQLLWRDQSVDGLKTGHTEAAGYCLAASAKRNNMRLIVVVMGSSSDKQRTLDAERLLNYGFRFFSTRLLYRAGDPLHKVRVWGGERKFVGLGVKEDFYVTFPRNAKGKLKVEKNFRETADAPVRHHQAMGIISVTTFDKNIRQAPLVALQAVPKGGWLVRATDSFMKLF